MTRALVVLLLLPMLGCSYVSQYRPPRDERARPIWDKNRVRVHLSERPRPACDRAVTETVEGRPLAIAPSYTYDPQEQRGLSRPPVFVFVPVIFWYPYAFPAPLGFWGYYYGGQAGELLGRLQIFAVVALLVLPIVAIGLSASSPEEDKASTLAIDAANAFNDLSRSPGNPCSYAQAGPPAPEGAE